MLRPHAGGAWTIGYKAWGALLARRLSQQGVLVACLDYRNFPQVRGRGAGGVQFGSVGTDGERAANRQQR